MLISKALEIYRGVSHGYPNELNPNWPAGGGKTLVAVLALEPRKSRRFCGGFEHINDRNMKIMIVISITTMIM
jgi:hypothetical protein